MAAAPRLAPVLLEEDVRELDYPVKVNAGRAYVKVTKKKAFGCGKYGRGMAEGVHLLARLVDNNPCRCILYLAVEGKVYRSVKARGLDLESGESSDGGMRGDELVDPNLSFTSYVRAADKNVIVLSASFSNIPRSDAYYLVYDADRLSLSMIPHLRRLSCYPRFTGGPLPVRHGDKYALVLMARHLQYLPPPAEGECHYPDVICLWPPTESSQPPPPPVVSAVNSYTYPAVEPWYFKEPRFPNQLPECFMPQVMFSFNDHAFWADLRHGVLCCRCSDLLTGGYHVDFSYISLPPGCNTLIEGSWRPELFRTMGCSGGSIKFVSITLDAAAKGDNTVTVWTLSMRSSTWEWNNGRELFRATSLWRLMDFKKARLPETVPWCPFLSPHEAEGSILYFVLSKTTGTRTSHHMCSFDMRRKKLLKSKNLPWCRTDPVPPAMLTSEFCSYLDQRHLVVLDEYNIQDFAKRTERRAGLLK